MATSKNNDSEQSGQDTHGTGRGTSLATLTIAAIATMSRNARDAADYFRVPTNCVIELGTPVEI